MDLKEIQEMFSEMGLGTSEIRANMVKELSINMVDSSYKDNYEIKTCNNTLKTEQYA